MRRTHFRQEAFLLVGVFLKQVLGHDGPQHGIAQKLQPLVGLVAAFFGLLPHRRRVRERQVVELRVGWREARHSGYGLPKGPVRAKKPGK